MLELKPKPTVSASQARVAARVASEDAQPRKLLLALVLLLVALAGVVMKDRQFWFGSEQSALDSDRTETTVASKTAAQAVPGAAKPAHSASAPATALTTKKRPPAVATSTEPTPADAPIVATNRTVLPPLDVEVIAGDTHSKIHPGSNAAKVAITHPGSDDSSAFAATTNAAERESIPSETPQASYPLLAQHMNVQGSVILQAVIGADGIIQNLHVVSGPAILATAAQQAVREWHFKPILQHGQPVETKARITVNFTIKVGDNSGTTIAESRPEDIQILSR
jgi:TonB family protein